MEQTQIPDWLTKQEAAQRLRVSEKTIEKLAKDGQLQQAERKRPGKPPQAIFHPGDVERVAKERNRDPSAFVMPSADEQFLAATNGKELVPAQLGQTGVIARLADALEAMRARAHKTPAAQKLFLTVAEAADYSGLPAAHLRRLMKEQRLEAMKTGGGWRIRRADLEKL